ncbi:MAG: GNAT family N-acetyltransferase [Acidobacteriota bacterium]|nr:MAG: GNAT family N-acetyltransferase [Acidobacteriota bacterium]
MIRPYSAGDLEAVIAIFRSNIPKYFVESEESELREFLADSVENYYVIELNGEVVGAGGIALNADDTVSLCWGMVHSSRLGTGLGKLLTEYRLARSQEMFGAKPIVTNTSQHTSGFYERLGFVMIEHTPDGFGPGIDICRMRKEAGN